MLLDMKDRGRLARLLSILRENLETGSGPRAELTDGGCNWRLVGQDLADHRAATTWINRLLRGEAAPVKRAPKSRARRVNALAGVR